MIASHRTSEITFYEELGLSPDASPEAIRDTFRALVRLLHPDQQTDPHLKEIAEKQMRKLNRIYGVLSDPERRRRYDELLEDDFAPAIILNSETRPDLRRVLGRLTWVAAAVASLCLLIWLAASAISGTQGGTAYAPQGRESGDAFRPDTPGQLFSRTPGGDMAAIVAGLRSDLRSVTGQRDAAIRELVRLRGTNTSADSGGLAGPDNPASTAQPATMTELPQATRFVPQATPVTARTEESSNRRLTGFWFYTRPPEGQRNRNKALYPPEYIEAVITEENGVLHGRYRSRFQVVDRGISPEVNFTFSGTPNGSGMSSKWSGGGGASGEVSLRLTSDNSMKLDWTATDLGTQQGLISGTAMLTRRIE